MDNDETSALCEFVSLKEAGTTEKKTICIFQQFYLNSKLPLIQNKFILLLKIETTEGALFGINMYM